jgi:hypothetical protein
MNIKAVAYVKNTGTLLNIYRYGAKIPEVIIPITNLNSVVIKTPREPMSDYVTTFTFKQGKDLRVRWPTGNKTFNVCWIKETEKQIHRMCEEVTAVIEADMK